MNVARAGYAVPQGERVVGCAASGRFAEHFDARHAVVIFVDRGDAAVKVAAGELPLDRFAVEPVVAEKSNRSRRVWVLGTVELTPRPAPPAFGEPFGHRVVQRDAVAATRIPRQPFRVGRAPDR